MATYRAAYFNDVRYTAPEQAHLSDAELIEAAVAEARNAHVIGTDGGFETEDEFRAALHIGDFTD